MGMMHRYTIAYQSPLYGRASAQIRLKPLPYGATKEYFPDYDASERVAIYSIFGGIPAYWERMNRTLSISDNIQRQLLTANNLMQSEPLLLLHDFVREPDNYLAILKSIANNYRTQKEIMSFTVERRIPITAGVRSRLSRYYIVDPYLRFYFRFLASRQTQIEMGIQKPALEEIKRHFLDFIGRHTWEEICREWALRASIIEEIPYLIDQVGSAWNKSAEVDVVGINRMDKVIIMGECKWGQKPQGASVMHALIGKTNHVVPTGSQWKVYYLGMARGGWSGPAKEWASTMMEHPPSGKNWTAVGVKLLDLATIDSNLIEWT